MKTALQEFIDNVIPMHIIELDMIKQEIKKALEKEKEQMLNEWQKGFEDAKYIYNQNK
jgi:GH35 family endo-1,4-beta-xylanase